MTSKIDLSQPGPSDRAAPVEAATSGRNYFEQLELRDPRGRTQTFLVSTERFEREFGMTAMVPVRRMSIAHGHKSRKLGASEKWPEYSLT
jgi:hypothetical protein